MRTRHTITIACLSLVFSFAAAGAVAQEPAAGATQPVQGDVSPGNVPAAPAGSVPTVKFFYYDAGGVEWVVSAEPERFARHLAASSDSQSLYQAVTAAVSEPANLADVAQQMTRWIERERERFDETRRESARSRMAEGVVAYLRAHDFSIQQLVAALKRHSGATEVELVVVHLVDARDMPSYKLKVVLVDPQIAIGKQGFNVNLDSPRANYTVVTYALGVALYEVQELVNRDKSEGGSHPPESIEPLPVPDPVDAARPAPPNATAGR